MRLNPYLSFDGNCRAAFQFYERCFGGKIELLLTFGETPACEHVAPTHHDKIMHVRLQVDGQVLMGSDSHPTHPYQGIKGCSVALHFDTVAEGERVFNALAEKGTITMPFSPTFWAAKFGMVTDQFGVPWIVNCEKE